MWRILPKLLALALVGELASAAFTSPVLTLQRARVVGLHTVSEREVLQAARVPFGRNIFKAGLSGIARHAATHPVMDRVEASWQLPHTIVLRATERKPIILIRCGDSLYEMDAKRVPFRLRTKELPGTPIVEAEGLNKIKLGKPISSPTLEVALTCLRLKGFPGPRDISKISVDLNGNLCLNIRDGVEVRLGQPDKLTVKLASFRKLKMQAPQDYQRIQYVDLSCPEAPIAVKYRDDVPQQPDSYSYQ